MEVAIIGSGTIGSTAAYTLALERPALDITLVDVDEDLAEGHAIDTRHGRLLASLPQFGNAGSTGSITHAGPEPSAIESADVAVVAASVERPPESVQQNGRSAFLEGNLEIAREVGELLAERDPLPVVVVSNPMDRITHRVWEATGWDRHRILGYSLCETARAADKLSERLDVPAAAIYCPVGGEHGEHVVPMFSQCTVDGDPVDLSEADEAAVLQYVREIAYDVIELRGPEDSTRWLTGQGITRLVGAILDGGVDGRPITVSVPLDGEYGIEGATLSVPVEIDRSGVSRILEWDLSADELEGLHAAADAIRADI
ncbi:Malate/lactate dehydrogenase [Halanaeroarchaeum sp. HSR-CO]|uniref:malate dehydrogenase n=1 Tax=Halanaeroarchaeum sp. HSR-CO TaxID=2866382 RepID=UPI00217EE01F|nr:lactate dehydrogenase [Halanaeroarchaeum sp. HSR-CO]UWG46518.1 Malate/lactate dehydrogenase [Halanaeroarchaeum sp. HSR-CO]